MPEHAQTLEFDRPDEQVPSRLAHFSCLAAGPLAYAVCVLSDPLAEVSAIGMRTLGIFIWTIIWWVTEPLPIAVTSFVAMALLVLMGVQPVAVAFSAWANWIIIFLLAACIIGHALRVHGVSDRVARTLVASRVVNGKPWRILLLFGLGAAAMSSVMSHVVTTLIFINLGLGIAKTFRLEKEERFAECLFLAIAWGSNLGILTPVGTPPNLIAIGMIRKLGYQMGFLDWIMACAPAFLAALATMFLVMRYVLRPVAPAWQPSREALLEEVRELGPLTRGGKIASAVFICSLLVWMLPDFVPLLLLGGNRQHPVSLWLGNHLDWSVSAVLMAATLFMIPLNWKRREFVMSWQQAVEGIDWTTLALISGALAVGNAIADPEVGLGRYVARSLASLSAAGDSELIFVLAVVGFTIIVGTFISNIAIVTMVGTLIMAIAPATTLFNPVALLVAVGMAASFDFALPIGTPPSQMVFGTKYVRAETMAIGGVPLALVGIPICTFFGYYLTAWMTPWPVR